MIAADLTPETLDALYADLDAYLADEAAAKRVVSREIRMRRTDDRGMLTLQVSNGYVYLWIASDTAAHRFTIDDFRGALDHVEETGIGSITEASGGSDYWGADTVSLHVDDDKMTLSGPRWPSLSIKAGALRQAFESAMS